MLVPGLCPNLSEAVRLMGSSAWVFGNWPPLQNDLTAVSLFTGKSLNIYLWRSSLEGASVSPEKSLWSSTRGSLTWCLPYWSPAGERLGVDLTGCAGLLLRVASLTLRRGPSTEPFRWDFSRSSSSQLSPGWGGGGGPAAEVRWREGRAPAPTPTPQPCHLHCLKRRCLGFSGLRDTIWHTAGRAPCWHRGTAFSVLLRWYHSWTPCAFPKTSSMCSCSVRLCGIVPFCSLALRWW